MDYVDVVLQADEVDKVKYVMPDEMLEMLFNTEYRDDEYREVIENYIRELIC